MISEITDFTQEMADKFGCIFSKQPTGSYEWTRVFVRMPPNISIGRFSFKNGKLEACKFYKPSDYPLAEEDKIMLRLFRYVNCNVYTTSERYDILLEQAKRLREEDIKMKLKRRSENPKIKQKLLPSRKIVRQRLHRRKITGRSVRSFLLELLSKEVKLDETA